MDILFITDNFPPETNAPASRTFEHAMEWASIGHEVSVITCAPNFPFGKIYDGYQNRIFQRENMNGINVYRVWSYVTRNKGFLKRVLDFMSFMFSAILGSFRVTRPDVVIATSPQLFSAVAGYLVSKLKRCPFIFEVRDLWPEQILAVKAMKQNVVIRLLFRLAGYLYHHADHVVTVGDGYKEQIQAGYNVSDEQIDVIPNGILPEMFSKNGRRNKIRKQLGWNRKFVVLYLGTHGMSHKLETVMEAAELLKSSLELCFAFVGDGAEKEKLLRIKDDKKLDNCLFYMMQPKEKVPDFYEAANACVIPLLRCELFRGNYPSKLFEAMAMECPIILSSEGYSRKLLNEAKAGISVLPEDPGQLAQGVQYLYQHPDECVQMGRRGREFVLENYSRKVWAKRYLDLIGRVVNEEK